MGNSKNDSPWPSPWPGIQKRSIFWTAEALSSQEKSLTQWILMQSDLGLPPTHAQIKQFTTRILAVKGDHEPLGKRWMQAFLRRNPSLRTQRAHSRESARINGATTEVIRPWFNRLHISETHTIKPENRYNMDEAGIMEGLGENGLVVGSAEKRSIQKKTPGSRAWTSFLECISATGVSLPPLVMFKGKSVQQQWFPEDLTLFEGWEFTATHNGWTTDKTAVEWLEKIFIPLTQPSRPQEKRLLVLMAMAVMRQQISCIYASSIIYICYFSPLTPLMCCNHWIYLSSPP